MFKTTMRWTFSVSVLAMGLCQAEWAGAQEAEKSESSTVGVTDILVLGRSSDGTFARDKALATIRETPSSITIIDSERLEKQRLLSLDDVMKQTAGVTVVRNLSTYPRFFARGFQVSSFLMDGTPQQGYALPPYSVPDLFVFDHVEFLRGPSALFSGSGSPGGSVNLVRKRPKKDFALTASLSAGSWDFYRAELDISSPLNSEGTIRGRAGGMIQDAGDFIKDFSKDRQIGFASLDVDLGESTTFSVGGYYDDYKTTQAVGLPGSATTGLLDLPRDSFFSAKGSYAHTKQAQLYAQLSHDFGEQWKFGATVQYNDLKRDELYAYPRTPVSDANAGIVNLETYHGRHQAHAVSADANLTGEYELFGRASGLILGVDYQRSKWAYQSNYLGVQTPPLLVDIFNPVLPDLPDFPVTADGPNYYAGNEVKEQYGIYGQTRVQPIKDVTLVLGGRIGWVSYKTQDFDDQPNGVHSVKGKLAPYVGLVYNVAPKWTLYTSYADVFEPQSAFDRSGAPLGPVSGTQYEVGVKTNVLSDRFLLSFAAYRIRQSNRAVSDPVDMNASIASGLVEGKGFEIEMNGQVTPEWSISGGYNFNRNRVLSDTDPALEGTQFTPVIPKHSVKLFTDYNLPVSSALHGLSLGGAISWNSRQRGAGVEQKAYFVADARAGYDVTPRVNLSVNLTNIFDKRYYSEIRDARFGNWYGAPRSLFGTLRLKY